MAGKRRGTCIKGCTFNRKTENTGDMVRCDMCKDWFHKACIKEDEETFQNFWMCAECGELWKEIKDANRTKNTTESKGKKKPDTQKTNQGKEETQELKVLVKEVQLVKEKLEQTITKDKETTWEDRIREVEAENKKLTEKQIELEKTIEEMQKKKENPKEDIKKTQDIIIDTKENEKFQSQFENIRTWQTYWENEIKNLKSYNYKAAGEHYKNILDELREEMEHYGKMANDFKRTIESNFTRREIRWCQERLENQSRRNNSHQEKRPINTGYWRGQEKKETGQERENTKRYNNIRTERQEERSEEYYHKEHRRMEQIENNRRTITGNGYQRNGYIITGDEGIKGLESEIGRGINNNLEVARYPGAKTVDIENLIEKGGLLEKVDTAIIHIGKNDTGPMANETVFTNNCINLIRKTKNTGCRRVGLCPIPSINGLGGWHQSEVRRKNEILSYICQKENIDFLYPGKENMGKYVNRWIINAQMEPKNQQEGWRKYRS